jgi:tRNA (guanine9-N1)-methyltransferase
MMHQFAHCYSANSKAPSGCSARLCFTDLRGELADAYDKYPGTASWPVLRSGEGLSASFSSDAARLVYLTADSPHELQELSPGDIYVIGGLVDRNRHKGITLRKADGEGIRHARLPLAQHCKLAGSAVLTVNQVVDILLAWLEVRDWRAACLRAIPPRKRVAEDGGGDQPAGAAAPPPDGATNGTPHSGAEGHAAGDVDTGDGGSGLQVDAS